MDKVRVVFVTPFTSGGGACRNMFNIIEQLGQDYDTTLVVTGKDELPNEYSGLISTTIIGKSSVTGSYKKLSQILKRIKPDYIFATTLNTGLICALINRTHLLRSKVISRCTVTPSEIYQITLKNKLLQFVLKIAGGMIDQIISQTEFMKKDLTEYYGFAPDKIKTIRNIVNLNHIKVQASQGKASEFISDSINILSVGALYSVKGYDILIDSIAPLIKKNPKIHLYIIGEERYEQGYKSSLKYQIENYGLTDNILLLGPRENPFPYYKAADLFVLSSRKEGYPNVVLEALSLNTPVIATNVVDFSDVIINGVNGFIVDKDSINSMRWGLESALSSLDKLSKNKITIDNFDFKTLFV